MAKKKKYPPMTDEQVKALYVAVLEIAAHERGLRRKAQDFIKLLVAEMVRRGI